MNPRHRWVPWMDGYKPDDLWDLTPAEIEALETWSEAKLKRPVI
jgi:hypothetical protein